MSSSDSHKYAVIDQLAEEFAERYRRGERPSLQDYIDRYPDLADDIRAVLPTLVQVEQAEEGRRDAEPPPAPALSQVGDYRILREIGHGGMGVVYEAEQVSLGRRVALKVLPLRASQDPRALERFRREAKAVARLHHTNIVPVFEVGQAGDTCFYAMQFIAGQGLDQVIEELRRFKEGTDGGPRRAETTERSANKPAVSEAARALLTGEFAERLPAPLEQPGADAPATPDQAPSTTARLPGDTDLSSIDADRGRYYRSVARVGQQVADALAHAHARGVVHRDIKPSNLLLDSSGVVWVTDFGLAKTEEEGLTRSGDVVGTIRYMAPERFRGECDGRADVYALGLTLYELLALRPAFDARDRPRLIDQIQNEEPPRPRSLDPHVPRDLETVVLKALDKDPRRRYQTAEEMAEDLRRFLAGEPIRARRVGLAERLAKWARRRPAGAALLVVGLLLLLGAVVGGFVYNHQLTETRAAARAQALLQGLRSADTQDVAHIVEELQEYRDRVEAPLESMRDKDADARVRLHASLALLPGDAAQAYYLSERLLTASPAESAVIPRFLEPHAATVAEGLWQVLLDRRAASKRRLPAAAALAAFEPGDRRWADVAAEVVEMLLVASPREVDGWTVALQPARAVLIAPLLRKFRDPKRVELERQLAARVLADYAADNPDVLAEALLGADPWQFSLLFSALQERRKGGVAALRKALGQPAQLNQDAGSLAGWQANAAVALLRLEETEPVWPLFRHHCDPGLRSQILVRLAAMEADPWVLVERLRVERNNSARRALILALGEFDEERLPAATREEVVELLLTWYQCDPDPGVHGAIDWLFRQAREGDVKRPLDWGQRAELDKIDLALMGQPAGKRNWFVNNQGQTLTRIDGPVEFVMGSPVDEPGRDDEETPHLRRIGRNFAIGTKEVTVGQWRAFLKANSVVQYLFPKGPSPAPDDAVGNVTWYDAAQYCRWLSDVEGVPLDQMCFPSVAEIEECKDGAKRLILPRDYLTRTGYRLPTEAEWEYACRAGAATARSYGDSVELLDRYAWTRRNNDSHARPVGEKRPNDLGLFDMHGNVGEWCQEGGSLYEPGKDGQPAEDVEDRCREVDPNVWRILRGGTWADPSKYVRCGRRNINPPGMRIGANGFRLARTYPD